MHNKSYAYLIGWFLALHEEGFKDLITQTFHMHYSLIVYIIAAAMMCDIYIYIYIYIYNYLNVSYASVISRVILGNSTMMI